MRAIRYLRHFRVDTAGALLSLLLVSATNLAAPQLIRFAIDHGLAANDWSNVRLAMFGLVGVAVVRGLLNFLQGYLAERASQGVAFLLRDELYTRIQKLSFSYYDQAQTGNLLTRLTNDVEQVRTFVGSGVVQLAAALAMLVGTVVLLLSMNATLGLAALLTVVPIFVVLRRFVGSVGPLFFRLQATLGRLSTVLQESLQGLKVIRAFSQEGREAARYAALNTELRDQNLQIVSAMSTNFPFVNFFANTGTIAVVGVGGYLILHDRLTLGSLVAFNGYLAFLLMPIMTIGFLAAQISRAAASAQRVFELLDTASEVTDAPDAVTLPTISGRVEFKNVVFRYAGTEKPQLRGVTFTIEPGQTVALLGTTGAGKSTIINLIPRFYDVTSGQVLIDGHDVRHVALSSLRSHIGIVLQEALLFSGTVRANIAFGRPDATLDEVKKAAAAAQAAAFIEALPQGYDTVVGERGVGLSGGQRQRIAIARALLTDPQLLILDDSTSAVDAETELGIQRALDALMHRSNKTAFVIAQRMSTVRDADVILVLDDGQVVAQGRHEDLLANSPQYNEILGTQFRANAEPATVARPEVA